MALMYEFYSTKLQPNPDDTIDLGSSSLEFKDLYIDGIAYIDGFGQDLDLGDFDITSIDGLFGFDANVFIDMGADGRIIIQADGAGTAFSTPDIDITGTVFFDDDIGLDTTKKIMFRDTALYISSIDDGHLDLTADTSIDLNGITLATDKISFTQVDNLEYIDSLNDGYLDIEATTAIRLRINGAQQLILTDGKLAPYADRDIDLGDTNTKFGNAYFIGINAVSYNDEPVFMNDEMVFA